MDDIVHYALRGCSDVSGVRVWPPLAVVPAEPEPPPEPPPGPTITTGDPTLWGQSGYVTVAWNVPPNATVTVTFPDGTTATAVADAQGDFSVTSAGYGLHWGAITIAVTSNGGTETTSWPYVPPPAITMIDDQGDGTTMIHFSGMDGNTSGARIVVTLPDGSTAVANGATQWEAKVPNDEVNACLTAESFDSNGVSGGMITVLAPPEITGSSASSGTILVVVSFTDFPQCLWGVRIFWPDGSSSDVPAEATTVGMSPPEQPSGSQTVYVKSRAVDGSLSPLTSAIVDIS